MAELPFSELQGSSWKFCEKSLPSFNKLFAHRPLLKRNF